VLGCSRVGAEEGNWKKLRSVLTGCYRGDHIEEDVMGRACGALGERRNACRAMKAMSVVM